MTESNQNVSRTLPKQLIGLQGHNVILVYEFSTTNTFWSGSSVCLPQGRTQLWRFMLSRTCKWMLTLSCVFVWGLLSYKIVLYQQRKADYQTKMCCCGRLSHSSQWNTEYHDHWKLVTLWSSTKLWLRFVWKYVLCMCWLDLELVQVPKDHCFRFLASSLTKISRWLWMEFHPFVPNWMPSLKEMIVFGLQASLPVDLQSDGS